MTCFKKALKRGNAVAKKGFTKNIYIKYSAARDTLLLLLFPSHLSVILQFIHSLHLQLLAQSLPHGGQFIAHLISF